MKYAIFSDVHGNLGALGHMLHHAREQGAQQYLYLGDIGYDACIESLRQAGTTCIFGNGEVSTWRSLSPENQAWVLSWTAMQCYSEENFWVSHASPLWPQADISLQSYLDTRRQLQGFQPFPYYLSLNDAMFLAFETLMQAPTQVLFHGHTHIQKTWVFQADNRVMAYPPKSFALQDDEIYIIGVGSVGQARDFSGLCYVLFDSDSRWVEFVRLS